MLVIRSEQMQALNRRFETAFRDAVVEHLASADPAKFGALGDAGVEALIDRSIKRAAAYEIDLESDVFDFIDMLFEEGEDFLDRPSEAWALEILEDRAESGSARMSRINAWRDALSPLKQGKATHSSNP